MIITDKINVKIINHNIEHYKQLGYNIKYGDIINIPIEHLTLGSHYVIDVKCDHCKSLRKIRYQDYIKVTKNKTEKYYCHLCVKEEKTKQTFLKLYGVSNPSQSDIVKKLKEKTNLSKWGVKNVFQNEDIKNKIRDTNNKIYGCDYPNQSDIIKNKTLINRIKQGKQVNKSLVLY
jgi:hypothetical protein